MPADHHWIALDHAFSQVLTRAQLVQARTRLARRAATLSDIYLPRIASILRHAANDRGDLTREVLELEDAHRALSTALAAAHEDENLEPVTEPTR